jgi:heat shock protein HslJ
MKYLTLLVLIAALFACKNRNIQDSKKIDLEGADLFFIGINGPGIDSFNLPPYKLNLNNGQYTLSLDVNSCSGTYEMKGKEIKFNNDLSCTKICCDGPNAQALKEILKSNFIVKKEGENFILNQGGLQLKLSKNAPQKNSALIGKKYHVSKAFSMGNEYKPDFEMIVEFNENAMQLQLNANSCSASCEVTNDQLKFSEGLTCTEKCCDSELALKLAGLFNGTMQYVIDANNPVIFSKNSRIWLVPYDEIKKDLSAMYSTDLIGNDFKITEMTVLAENTKKQFSFDYILSFRAEGLGLKLDKNSCNTSATYIENKIEIGDAMGCTKLCCDSKESLEIKNYLKGKFELSKNGEIYTLSNDVTKIKLIKLPQ